MHHFHWELAGSIVVLLGIILVAVLLRRLRVLSSDHGRIFSTLILKVTLPALIFKSLYNAHIEMRLFVLVGLMILAQFVVLFITYGAGRLMSLSRPQIGALMLTSAFGSSCLLGYAFVAQAFPGNDEAMTEAAMISEMAVAPMVFTVGILVAIYFGSGNKGFAQSMKKVLTFFHSPAFIALVAGLVCSMLHLPEPTGVVKVFFNGLGAMASANTFLAAMTIGVLFRFEDIRTSLGIAGVACLCKLLLLPLLVWLPMQFLDISQLHQKVLIIEAAMPAMMMSVPFANEYGCDGKAASIALLVTNVVSIFSMIIVLSVLVG